MHTARQTGRIATGPMLLFFAVAASSGAVAAPAALYGKSVVVSWSETSQQRYVGEANFRSVLRSVSTSIYISSIGRVFSRQTNATRTGSGSTEQVAGLGGNGGRQSRVPAFSGQAMTMFGPVQGGVRRVSVTFDAGFGSCTADVGFAKEVGRASFNSISPITNRPLEIVSVTPGAASCSVRDGNVFAGE